MSAVHEWVGFAVVALFAIGWLWPLGAMIVRRGPGELFWRWLTVAQVAAGTVQPGSPPPVSAVLPTLADGG